MNITIEALFLLIFILLYVIVMLILKILVNKLSNIEEIFVRAHKRLAVVLSLVKSTYMGSFENLSTIYAIQQTLIVDVNEGAWQQQSLQKIQAREIKKLRARWRVRRKEAAIYLGILQTEKSRIALEEALLQEKDYSVKIYISNAITDILSPASLPVLLKALIGSHKWYREKAISNILEYDQCFFQYFEQLYSTTEMEYIELLIKYASENIGDTTKKYLLSFVDDFDLIKESVKDYYIHANQTGSRVYKLDYVEADLNGLLERTCRTLANIYYNDLAQEKYIASPLPVIKTNAFWAYSKLKHTEALLTLLDQVGDTVYHRTITATVGKMLEDNPRFLYLIEDAFEKETDPVKANHLAEILSTKVEYYVLKLNTKSDMRSEKILKAIIQNDKINALIGFINRNKNTDIENRLVHILKETLVSESDVAKTFQSYLNHRMLEKIGLTPISQSKERHVQKKDPKLIKAVIGLTLLSLLAFPVYFYFKHYDFIREVSPRTLLKYYVIDYNYLLAYYSVAVNLSYLILMCFSYVNLRKQSRLWNLKNVSMLFRKQMLPSISIVAPAYNEELTIIDSTNSLLNLNYPDYELIIVNDGSSDETLQTLITHYSLVRSEYLYKTSLPTEPIRGIYRNPSYPKLLVVDKSNGGKADSLNAGINVANKTYFCGIDADSLLESDALLKLASMTLDESRETPALGGNVFPINGCQVEYGHIAKTRIPDSSIARFQTIEYLRAFMSGRLGWEQLNSLLIISGAFGLFRKDRIINIGGYMTYKGKYAKDTVGEDMELVIRISRMLHESNQKFKILYAFNANCWTQVPEDLKSLKNQRYRWHRGLMDILFFHKKMILNPRYGSTGLIGLPYYLCFEAFGPMIEIQGYLMVVLAAILGILDQRIALLLFATTILLGVLVSLTSLLIAEKESNYFSAGDVSKLVFYAIIENFGPRQLFSFWRVLGQFKVIWGHQGWGHIQRKEVRKS